MSETDLSRAIRQTLELRKIWIERIQSGQLRVQRAPGGPAYYVHCASEGTPDYMLPAHFAFAEIKRPGEKLNPAQERWHARARAAGVRCVVWRSPKEALQDVRKWEQEDRKSA